MQLLFVAGTKNIINLRRAVETAATILEAILSNRTLARDGRQQLMALIAFDEECAAPECALGLSLRTEVSVCID